MKISNSGPLIVLYNSSLLYILKELHGNVVVPKAVFDEITRKEEGKQLFLENNWITLSISMDKVGHLSDGSIEETREAISGESRAN